MKKRKLKVIFRKKVIFQITTTTQYIAKQTKNLPTYWDIFVESAALYGVDLSDITDVEFISEDLSGKQPVELLVHAMIMLKYK